MSQASIRERELEDAQLPEWVTLHEAAFITRLTEEEIRAGLAAAGVGSFSMLGRRSRNKQAGKGLLLVRTEDLRRAGLLHPQTVPHAPDRVPQEPDTDVPSIWGDDSIFGSMDRLPPFAPPKSEEIFGSTQRDNGPVVQHTVAEARPKVQPATRTRRRPRAETQGLARRVTRGGLLTVLAATLTLALALVVFTFAPILLGFHTFTATSDEMSPSIRSGALLLDRSIRAVDAKVGDVVTFRDPNDSSRLITSRVVDKKTVAGVALLTTKGDASATSREWSVPTSGRINRVSIHVARLGSLVAWLRTGAGLITLALTPLGLMILVALLRERDPAWESPRGDTFWGELAGHRSA